MASNISPSPFSLLIPLISFALFPTPLCSASQAATGADDACRQLNSPIFSKKIPRQTNQMLILKSNGGGKAQMVLCQRQANAWMPVFAPFPAVVGKNGVAALGRKREGDLKTPAGLYAIGEAFGTTPLALRMDYKYITADDKYIDDVKHPQYNTWVRGTTDAKSYESMLIEPYVYGAILNYNTGPVTKGLGSAIFIHVWRAPNIPTAGCIALEKSHVVKLLHWLDKKQHPFILIQEK